jgi:hypothetical protein
MTNIELIVMTILILITAISIGNYSLVLFKSEVSALIVQSAQSAIIKNDIQINDKLVRLHSGTELKIYE